MQLSTLDRLLLLSILPKEGDITTIKIVRSLREALSWTEEEHKERNFQQDDKGQISWTMPAQDAKNIQIGEKARAIIAGILQKLSDEKKLNEQLLSLYEKFAEE